MTFADHTRRPSQPFSFKLHSFKLRFFTRPLQIQAAQLLAFCFCLTSSIALNAEELAHWNFENTAQFDDVNEVFRPDAASANNLTATLTTTGSASTISGDNSVYAANFGQLNVNQTSAITFDLDTEAYAFLSVSFSARTTNTASKYWRVQVNSGDGFSDVAPLISFTGSTTFSDFIFSLPAPIAGTSISFRLLASDDAGDGTGAFVQADGSGTPSSVGKIRLDNVIFTGTNSEAPDAGSVSPDAGVALDAGPVDAGTTPLSPLQITEVFFNSTSQDASREWIEISNVSSMPISLEGWTLTSAKNLAHITETQFLFTNATAGTPITPNETFLIAQSTDLGENICLESTRIVLVDTVSFALAHTATYQYISITSPAEMNFVQHEVQYLSSGQSAANFDGRSLDVTTGAPSICTALSAFTGSPGITDAECTASGLNLCSVAVDGGTSPVEPDAGPQRPDPSIGNNAPEITLEGPTSQVSSANVMISYSASDPDNNAIEVALFYDTDDAGFDGVRIVEGLPGGSEQDYLWNTTGVPAGNYRIFGRVTDVFGAQSYSYATGTVQVGETTGANAVLRFIEPDGLNDLQENGTVLIELQALLPQGTSGTLSLFYDSDQEGADGTPLAAALPVLPDENIRLPWNISELPAGSYAIAAVLSWTGGETIAYSEYVQVSGGCSCTTAKGNHWGQLLLSMGALAMLLLPRRQRRKARSVKSNESIF